MGTFLRYRLPIDVQGLNDLHVPFYQTLVSTIYIADVRSGNAVPRVSPGRSSASEQLVFSAKDP
jgi:hypothetical protein